MTTRSVWPRSWSMVGHVTVRRLLCIRNERITATVYLLFQVNKYYILGNRINLSMFLLKQLRQQAYSVGMSSLPGDR